MTMNNTSKHFSDLQFAKNVPNIPVTPITTATSTADVFSPSTQSFNLLASPYRKLSSNSSLSPRRKSSDAQPHDELSSPSPGLQHLPPTTQNPLAANSKLNQTDLLSMTSTLEMPNVGKVVFAVATMLRDQIIDDTNNFDANDATKLFDEATYINNGNCCVDVQNCECLYLKPPTVEDITEFMLSIYNHSQFSPACNILCYVYINRLLFCQGISLNSHNWRKLVFIALRLAQKMWDDSPCVRPAEKSVFYTVKQAERMEKEFLRLIDYKVLVSPSTYARYYFNLRSILRSAAATEGPVEVPVEEGETGAE